MIPYLGCEGARAMIEPFVDDELAVSDQVALEAHLRWCDTCRARLDDFQLIGSALRRGATAAAVGPTEASALAALQDGVLMRVSAEHDQSLAVRWREWFADMRYLWPAAGATTAVALCIWASTLVNGIFRAGHPDSMAALISMLANPASDQARARPRSGIPVPPPEEPGYLFASPEEEAVFAVAAVVTREGRISNYELLQVREPLAARVVAPQSDEVSAVLNAVRSWGFEPARTGDGSVAVNMVWLLTRTTVRASAKPDETDAGAINAEPAALRPARS